MCVHVCVRACPPCHVRSWCVCECAQDELAKGVHVRSREGKPSCLNGDGLPYGWDEAYTAEGVKYFINHVTQTTSWSPPVTPVSPKSPPAPERVTEGGRGEEEGEEEEKEEEEEKGKTNTSV
ncbi:unnamed protein product [Arctogadus glacialis]